MAAQPHGLGAHDRQQGHVSSPPREATLAAEQTPILEQDNYWDDDVARSLCAPCDLVPFKPSADVVLVGAVFAPKRAPSAR